MALEQCECKKKKTSQNLICFITNSKNSIFLLQKHVFICFEIGNKVEFKKKSIGNNTDLKKKKKKKKKNWDCHSHFQSKKKKKK